MVISITSNNISLSILPLLAIPAMAPEMLVGIY
jgi:hypothetical protein